MFVVAADATSLPRHEIAKTYYDKYDPRPIWREESHIPLLKFNKIKFRKKERYHLEKNVLFD